MPQGSTITLTPVAAPLTSVSTRHRLRHTAYDTLETMLSWLGGNTERQSHRDIKRAILAAYREFASLHEWNYLNAIARILLHGAYDLGSIEYVHTGSTYPRLVTLTDGVWPSWVEQGWLRIGEVLYTVERRIDSTHITLTEEMNPGINIPAGNEYAMLQDTYELPIDFTKGDRGQTAQAWGGMYYVSPRDWFDEIRHDPGNLGDPSRYTFMGNPRGTGGLVLRINPAPDQDQTLDLIYRRSMRMIRTWDASIGASSVSAGNTIVTLAGGGEFKPWHKGSVIRLSQTSKPAGGLDDPSEPYILERTLLQILTSTTAQMDEAADETLNAVGYRVSDPIDMEDESMYNAFVFGVRKHLAMSRSRDDSDEIAKQWIVHLTLAKEADNRDVGRRSASVGWEYSRNLSDGRVGADIE